MPRKPVLEQEEYLRILQGVMILGKRCTYRRLAQFLDNTASNHYSSSPRKQVAPYGENESRIRQKLMKTGLSPVSSEVELFRRTGEEEHKGGRNRILVGVNWTGITELFLHKYANLRANSEDPIHYVEEFESIINNFFTGILLLPIISVGDSEVLRTDLADWFEGPYIPHYFDTLARTIEPNRSFQTTQFNKDRAISSDTQSTIIQRYDESKLKEFLRGKSPSDILEAEFLNNQTIHSILLEFRNVLGLITEYKTGPELSESDKAIRTVAQSCRNVLIDELISQAGHLGNEAAFTAEFRLFKDPLHMENSHTSSNKFQEFMQKIMKRS